MNRILYLFTPILCLLSVRAYACNRIVNIGANVAVSVPEKSGVTIVLPRAVSSLVPPKNFTVHPIGAANPKTGQVDNPRSFLIESLSEGASDVMTVFLTGKEKGFLTFSLKSTKDGRGVQEFCLPDSTRYKVTQDYLSTETNMMLAMIRDDAAFGRKQISEKMDLAGFEKTKVQAARIFRAEGYTGYTFLVTNASSKAIRLNLPSLSFGKPNKAVMLHVDHEILEPCSKNKGRNPKENGCTTALRVLIDGDLKPKYLSSSEAFPFVYATDRKEVSQ